MSLDIGLAADHTTWAFRGGPTLSLADDGYYWFLHPLFADLAQRTGQYVDLYGDASFSGASLGVLSETLEQAKRSVADQPDTWQVYTGTQTAPVQREVYATVEKNRLLRLLADFQAVVRQAVKENGRVICFGD